MAVAIRVIITFITTKFAAQEIIGYGAIILSLSFVYVGIRHYRDKQNGGMLSFGEGLKMGMLIVLVPSVCFGLTDVLYITLINPQFYPQYIAHQEAILKATVPADEFAAKAAAMRKTMLFFSQPLVDFALMFFTVAPIGVIITVLSTFMLKRSAPKTGKSFSFEHTITPTTN